VGNRSGEGKTLNGLGLCYMRMQQPALAAAEAVRIARKFIVASVPSKEDDNPEHIQLFSRDSFTALWMAAGARGVDIQYVLNHMIAVVKV
jgi:hypothetical protein